MAVATALVNIRHGYHNTQSAGTPASNSETVVDSPTAHVGRKDCQSQDRDSSRSISYSESPPQTGRRISSTSESFRCTDYNISELPNDDGAISVCFNASHATNAWAGLLLKDASSRAEGGADWDFGSYDLGECCPTSVAPSASLSSGVFSPTAHDSTSTGTPLLDNTLLRNDSAITIDQGARRQQRVEPWHSSGFLQLQPRECFLFYDFIQNLSQWVNYITSLLDTLADLVQFPQMDFFVPTRPFATLVPHLAVR